MGCDFILQLKGGAYTLEPVAAADGQAYEREGGWELIDAREGVKGGGGKGVIVSGLP